MRAHRNVMVFDFDTLAQRNPTLGGGCALPNGISLEFRKSLKAMTHCQLALAQLAQLNWHNIWPIHRTAAAEGRASLTLFPCSGICTSCSSSAAGSGPARHRAPNSATESTHSTTEHFMVLLGVGLGGYMSGRCGWTASAKPKCVFNIISK